jgi:hypothetical protein
LVAGLSAERQYSRAAGDRPAPSRRSARQRECELGGLTPPASRPCAGRRNMWPRTTRVSSAPPTMRRDRPQASDARKKTFAVQPLSFSKFGGCAFDFPSEGIGGGKTAAMERYSGHVTARFFKPDDRLVDMRLQQICGSHQVVVMADVGITRAEANGLLHQRDHLLYRSGVKLAPSETVECALHVSVQRDRLLVFGNALLVSALSSQTLGL